MDLGSFDRRRFRRGADRRAGVVDAAAERRRSGGDRRQRGPDWLSLFRGADAAAVVETIGNCDVIALPAGATLLRPGDANRDVYLLLSGELAAYLDSALAAHAAMPIRPGECVGELSAIDGKPVSARVVAVTESRVLMLHQELFWNRLMAIPGVARNLMVALAERMRRSNEVTLEGQRKRLALEHLRQELDVARQLQAGMLPLRRPLFPGRSDLEVAGVMEPASAVGGDLFDAFFVDDQRLFFCVADVSGHGIPAALFMARAVGLMRIAAMGTGRPDEVLARINNQLCQGNDTSMFMTIFCGFLDVATGHLVYSNGGHCGPAVICDGKSRCLPMPKGTLTGAIPDLPFLAGETVLGRGDTLFCFTDGATEAQNGQGEEFSEVRLFEAAIRHANHGLDEMLDAVRQEIAAFTGNGTLDDDCTLLAVRRA